MRIGTFSDLVGLPRADITVARLAENGKGSAATRRALDRTFATWTGWPSGDVEPEDRALLPSLFESARSACASERLDLHVEPGEVMPAGGMPMGKGFAMVSRATMAVHDFTLLDTSK